MKKSIWSAWVLAMVLIFSGLTVEAKTKSSSKGKKAAAEYIKAGKKKTQKRQVASAKKSSKKHKMKKTKGKKS